MKKISLLIIVIMLLAVSAYADNKAKISALTAHAQDLSVKIQQAEQFIKQGQAQISEDIGGIKVLQEQDAEAAEKAEPKKVEKAK